LIYRLSPRADESEAEKEGREFGARVVAQKRAAKERADAAMRRYHPRWER
jgi:hypothetical protein